MPDQDGKNISIVKPAMVSFTSGVLGILSFLLMMNWSSGEYLIAPTLLLAFVSLVAGLVSARRMKLSWEKGFTKTVIYFAAFGTLAGACILLWFLLAVLIHY